MPTPDTVINQAAQFGLGGLVIVALFYALSKLLDKFEKLIQSTNERFDVQSNLHAEERKQWNESYEKNTEILRTLSAQFESKK